MESPFLTKPFARVIEEGAFPPHLNAIAATLGANHDTGELTHMIPVQKSGVQPSNLGMTIGICVVRKSVAVDNMTETEICHQGRFEGSITTVPELIVGFGVRII